MRAVASRLSKHYVMLTVELEQIAHVLHEALSRMEESREYPNDAPAHLQVAEQAVREASGRLPGNGSLAEGLR